MAIYYVRTDSTPGGDGTEDRTDGSTRAYATLAAALTARWTGTPTTPIEIECSAPTGVADTAAATIGDVTSTAANYLRIYPKAGHRAGTQWSTSKYRLTISAGSTACIWMNDEFARIEGIQLQNGAALSTSPFGVSVSRKASGDQRVVGCLIRLTGSTTSPSAYAPGIFADGNNAFKLTLANNICIGGSAGIRLDYVDAAGKVIVYNNLCVDQVSTGWGIRTSCNGGVKRLINNAVQGTAATNYLESESGGSATLTTNLSEDATSPNAALRNLAIAFVDEANGDYALAAGDTAAKDAGTDLSGDSEYAFTVDINGTTRSGTWDIGPHEYVAGGGGGSIPVIRHHLVQQGN